MILSGKLIKQELINNLKLKGLLNKKIGVISVGNNSSALSYFKGICAVANEVGVTVDHKNFDDTCLIGDIIHQIIEYNNTVDGILLLTPFPKHLDLSIISRFIDDNKDLDCLKATNIGKFYLSNLEYGPSTSRAVLKYIMINNYDVLGKNVVVVGASNIVGKPVAKLLLDLGATVTICNKDTVNLASYTLNADVIVLAAGVANLLDGSMVKENVFVIDVGINFVDGKLCGDGSYDSLLTKSPYITPVPGGVGVITSTLLFDNLAYLIDQL